MGRGKLCRCAFVSLRTLVSLALLISVQTLLGGCNATLEELCSGPIDEFRAEIKSTYLALNGPQEGSQRALASISDSTLQSRALDSESRDKLLKWAEARLLESQTAMDIFENYPERRVIRDEMSRVANDLVAFHGYCAQGRVNRMIAMLDQIDQRVAKAHSQGCAGVTLLPRSRAVSAHEFRN